MAQYRPYNPEQRDLFGYVDPDEKVDAKHPARFIDDLVEQLDLEAFHRRYSKDGSKGYDPRLHLKVFLLGYMEGVFTSRKLMQRCQRDIVFVWLCRGQVPDFRTIARFRRTHREDIPRIFTQIVRIARSMGMGKLGRLCIDSTTMKANASSNASADKDALEEQLKALEEYLNKTEKMDQEEDEEYGEDRIGNELPEDLVTPEKRRAKIQEALRKQKKLEEAQSNLEENTSKKANTTDPDCRFRHDGMSKQVVPGYGCHAVTSEDDIVLEAHVSSSPADHDDLKNVAEKMRSDLNGVELYADTGYYSVGNIEYLEQIGVDPVIPDQGSLRRINGDAPRQKRQGFVYDDQTDSFTCPVGEKLFFHNQTSERKNGRRRTRNVYRNPGACEDCRMKTSCVGKFPYKTLKVTGNPAQVEKYLSRFEQEETRRKYTTYRKRIEKTFGHIKGNLRFRQFLCRGLEMVQAEWSMICSAMNIMKMHKMALEG